MALIPVEEAAAVEMKETACDEYTAPKVEQVLSAEDVQREVHYAGGLTFVEPDHEGHKH